MGVAVTGTSVGTDTCVGVAIDGGLGAAVAGCGADGDGIACVVAVRAGTVV